MKLWEVAFLLAVVLASVVVHEEVHVLQFKNIGCTGITTGYFNFQTATYFNQTYVGVASTSGICPRHLTTLEAEIPAYGIQILFVHLAICLAVLMINNGVFKRNQK